MRLITDELRDLRDEVKEMRQTIEWLRAALWAADHTLSVHGHIDRDTPLHERLRDAADLHEITYARD